MGTLGGFLRLIRPINGVMMGFAVLVGAAIGSNRGVIGHWRELFLGFVASFTLTAAAMAINDYYDREIDAINEPDRPIPSGAVSPGDAIIVFLALSLVGFLTAWITSIPCFAMAVVSWFVMFFYSLRGKRMGLLGNILVSTCIAFPFIYGGLAVENLFPVSSLLFAFMAFFSNTGREVTKGIVDIEGDRRNGIRTVAVSRGAAAAAITATAFYISSAIFSFIPIYLGLVSFWYIPFVALTDLGLIHSSYSIMGNPSRENGKRVKNQLLIWMISGLLGFLTGRLL
jgi:geranylgeranylglycerol-phosphate geranylgeranyltransferase